MFKGKILWISLFLLGFLFFYFFFPLNFSYNNSNIASVLEAITLTFLLIQSFYNFKNFEEFNEWNRNKKVKKGDSKIFFIIIFGFVSFFIFKGRISFRVNDELKSNGIITKGEITGGKKEVKKNTLGSVIIDISYVDAFGKSFVGYDRDAKEIFDILSTDQVVDIVYSPNYPRIVKILKGKKSIKSIIGIEQRNLEINILIKILNLSDSNMVKKHLDSISFKWEKQNKVNNWSNENMSTLISLIPKRQITLVKFPQIEKRFQLGDGLSLSIYLEELASLGFEKVNDSTFISKKTENSNLSICLKEVYVDTLQSKIVNIVVRDMNSK